MNASVFIATSIDGYIARPDGGIDWLDDVPSIPDEDYGYHAFMDTVDVLVMGRNTFEKALSFGSWPYGAKPVVVLSSRTLSIPDHLPKSVEAMSKSPADLIDTLSKRGAKHLYIDGGITIQRFLNDGLIQRLIISRIPVLIGSGIPLFGPLQRDIKLRHVRTDSFPNGIEQSEHEIAK